jgi:phosphatidylserine/phosphatidylglycerophosphate/cardiolipin synthase-like enzyme
MSSAYVDMDADAQPAREAWWHHVVYLRSPRTVVYTVRALAERPQRHRRHDVLQRALDALTGPQSFGDDRWFPDDFPPRRGNRLIPLVDGQEAMGAMYEAMEGARESIYLSAWCLTPQLRMLRLPPDDPDEPSAGAGGPHALLPLLARKAHEADVRVLLWPGAVLGKFARRHMRATHRALVQASPRLHARLDTHEKFGHCQHQKTLVVDGRVAFVGGLDVTAFDADRWDVREHPFRTSRNWHDVHWQIEGPCVADVAANFAQRWNALAPHQPVPPVPIPSPLPGGGLAQVQRTIPQGVYPFAPSGIYGIAHAYFHAIARAERFIYLENQYLWSPEVTDALCAAIRRGVHVVIVLPAHPNIGKADTDRHVERLLQAGTEARAAGGSFRAYTLYTSWWDATMGRYHYRPIYVHSKIAIVDDAWATAGSANLNGRGMATDSEINVSTTDVRAIRELRLRLWAEHLGCAEGELGDADPCAVLGGPWAEAAQAQYRIVKRRSGALTAALYPYPLGHTLADFGPGEVESALLDR